MFMDKGELENASQLTMAKLRNSKSSFLWFGGVSAVLLLISITNVLGQIFKIEDYVESFHIPDFSILYFVVIVITLLSQTISYRQLNDPYSIYPQTNSTRFISTLLYQYLFIIFVAATFLLQYLIQYCLFNVLSQFHNNIFLALNFNFGFVIVGFFTYLMYAFLANAILSFIGVLLRKIGYYAILVAITVLSLLIVNLNWSVKLCSTSISFLSKEPSILLFFIKGLFIWGFITVASYIINKNTLYHITAKNISLKMIVLCVCIVLCSVVIFVNLLGSGEIHSSADRITHFASPYQMKEIKLDVSHLEHHSKLKIVCNDNIEIQPNGGRQFSEMMYYQGAATFVINSDQLFISYHYPFDVINGIRLSDYINPTLTVKIQDDNLILNYNYTKNVKVVLLPAWSMASQFDFFDKKIVKKDYLNYSSTGSGMIMISNSSIGY